MNKIRQAVNSTKYKLGVLGELFSFLAKSKNWWLIPMLIVLVVFGVLILFAQSSAIAPFIYTLI